MKVGFNEEHNIKESEKFLDPDDSYDLEDYDEDCSSSDESGRLYEHFRFVADRNQSLLRIDKYLIDRLTNISRNRIKLASEAGSIHVNGVPVKTNYRVKPSDVITIMMMRPPFEHDIIPENIPLEIVYEDEDLLVVNKQAGLVVHPGHGNYTGTLVNALAYYFKDEPSYDPNDQMIGLVHRIDKDTSGLLLIAKKPEAKTKLSLQFFNKTTQRKYQALVWGIPKQDEGTIEGNIGRDLRDRMKMTVFPDGEHGKTAVTHYSVIEKFGYVSLVECRLETGRTHQIRAHMKHRGHPVFNDERYGGNEILKGVRSSKYKQFINNCFEVCTRQALHAGTLGFVHPSTGREMFFDSEMPHDMKQLIERWRKYYNGV
jgi:23S rRNA pseudouridine1911/1915/1917 synthase